MRDYLDGGNWTLLDEFVEVESGRRNDRPAPEKALTACKKHRAKLVIAKLDRLSRNLAFIPMLMDRKVDFVCCDNPAATEFTIHILAAVAEHERDAISVRTKAALAADKAKGKKLGNYHRIAAAKQRATAERAEAVRPAIAETASPGGASRGRRAEPSRRQDRERQAGARDADHSLARSARPVISTSGWGFQQISSLRIAESAR